MELIVNVIRLIRAHFKCVFLKILNGKRFVYSNLLRMEKNVRIVVRDNSSIQLKKNVLISGNSVLSATDGGTLVIGENVGVNRNSMIMCHDSISIGDNTIMGPGVYIYDHDHKFDTMQGVHRNEYTTAPVAIGKNCWIGAYTIILRGTSIGDGCVVAAGSVLKGAYPPGSKIIQKRFTN